MKSYINTSASVDTSVTDDNPFAPLQPGDLIRYVTVYLVNKAVAGVIGDVILLTLVASGNSQKAGNSDRGYKIIANLTIPPVLMTAGAAISSSINVRIPANFRITQESRYVTAIIHTDTADMFGFCALDVVRDDPDGA